MTSHSKESIEAFGNVCTEITGTTWPLGWSLQAMEMLASKGFTIAPIARVTDEKLREAVEGVFSIAEEAAKYQIEYSSEEEGSTYFSWLTYYRDKIEAALSELAIYRANDKIGIYANRKTPEED